MAREYFEYVAALKGIGDKYNECPFECPNAVKRYDIARYKLCGSCPRKYQKDVFKLQYEEAVEIKLGPEYIRKYPFHEAEKLVYQVATLEELDKDSISLYNGALLSVYLGERADSRERSTGQ